MTLRRSLSGRLKGGLMACLLLLLAVPASARDMCQTVEVTIESLAIVQALSVEPDSRTLAKRLERSAESLQASGFTQDATNRLSLSEQTALQNYITALQQAAVLTQAGLVGDMPTIVAPHVDSELFTAISNLEQQGDCLPEETTEEMPEAMTAPQGLSTQSGSGTATGSPMQLRNPATGKPASGKSLPDTPGERRGAYAGEGAIVSGNTVMFYTMILGFGLVALVVYLTRRLNRQTQREARRVLSQPVKVFLNGSLHHFLLIDISMNGAKLGHAGEVAEDDNIGIDIGGTWYDAQVRWANAHFAGVKFKKALDALTLEQIA